MISSPFKQLSSDFVRPLRLRATEYFELKLQLNIGTRLWAGLASFSALTSMWEFVLFSLDTIQNTLARKFSLVPINQNSY